MYPREVKETADFTYRKSVKQERPLRQLYSNMIQEINDLFTRKR